MQPEHMEFIGFGLAGIGLLIWLVGAIQLLIAEFRVSIWWFLFGLFAQITHLLFICVHFGEAWLAVKKILLGLALAAAGWWLFAHHAALPH